MHRPLEWLLLLFVLAWLLPADVQTILEVRVLSAVVGWTFGASLIVHAIDALAGSAEPSNAGRASIDTAALRLRSLQLVGRTVVAFGLILVISAMVTGQGTIYQWVWSTCWFASIPTLLVLVRRWRDVVFRRTELVRKKSRFQQWVLANRDGWTSFIAATAGGVQLFVAGVARASRSWIGRFDVTRRFLAYLFRRELSKLHATREGLAPEPLPEAARVGLGPETSSAEWVKTDVDVSLDRLAARLRARSGGVIAIVGERGMGKTGALERLRSACEGTLFLGATGAGIEPLREQLTRQSGALGVKLDASLETAATSVDESTVTHAILVDDVHRLVQPVVGGLVSFDALLAVARRHSKRTTWVLTLDEVIWQFLARARGTRPLFDEVIALSPWREVEIVALLSARTTQVGLAPSFENLIERLPPNADDADRQEALAKRAANIAAFCGTTPRGTPRSRCTCGVARSGSTAQAKRPFASSRRWTSRTSSACPIRRCSFSARCSRWRPRTLRRSHGQRWSSRPRSPTRSGTPRRAGTWRRSTVGTA